MPERPTGSTAPAPVVVFDIDGTLLDSAPGIVAGFRHALSSVGFPPPDAATLREDLGPPVGDIFTGLGLPRALLDDAVAAYRAFYLEQGLQLSRPYDGVVELLDLLSGAGVTMATATAKLTPVARAIIEHHELTGYFAVVNGTDEHHHTKTETLAHTLDQLGRPSARSVLMVGDRHSDVTAAESCGVTPVAVSWGYGSERELRATSARLIHTPDELLALPPLREVSELSRR